MQARNLSLMWIASGFLMRRMSVNPKPIRARVSAACGRSSGTRTSVPPAPCGTLPGCSRLENKRRSRWRQNRPANIITACAGQDESTEPDPPETPTCSSPSQTRRAGSIARYTCDNRNSLHSMCVPEVFSPHFDEIHEMFPQAQR